MGRRRCGRWASRWEVSEWFGGQEDYSGAEVVLWYYSRMIGVEQAEYVEYGMVIWFGRWDRCKARGKEECLLILKSPCYVMIGDSE